MDEAWTGFGAGHRWDWNDAKGISSYSAAEQSIGTLAPNLKRMSSPQPLAPRIDLRLALREMSELHTLVGAYALHALDGDDHRLFEIHLNHCADCRAELVTHREAVTRIGEVFEAEPPSTLWDCISHRL